MATYSELHDFKTGPDSQDLVNRITVAVSVKAHAIADAASPTTEQIAWAVAALAAPRAKADIIVHYVLAANKDLTLAQITAASDSAVQNNVDAAVDDLFGV